VAPRAARQVLIDWLKAPLAGLFFYLWALNGWTAPQRIVTLSPHAAELVCAAGACERIVGVVDYTDFPPQLKHRPLVGNYAAINIEAILTLKPDLIITWRKGNPEGALAQLAQFGLPMIDSSPVKLEDIAKEIKRLGNILNTTDQANKVADLLQAQLDALKAHFYRPPVVSVFYEIWHQPLMTIGADQFISEAINLCGGRNIFSDIHKPAFSVNVEAVLARNPQVILIGGEAHTRDSWKSDWLKWPQLKATQTGQIYFVPPDLLQRPGPRLVAGTAVICYLLDQAKQNPALGRVDR